MKEKILVIGANGQIGSALVPKLQEFFGSNSVIASDLKKNDNSYDLFETADAADYDGIARIITKFKITQIYHLAAILSAKGEADPLWAWNANMQTLLNILEISRVLKIKKVFIPSSIAVFGDGAPRQNTPQTVNLAPSTVYGISKAAAECWIAYYHKKYGIRT